MPLAGKKIFVTGGSRGIGLAIALKAARDGAMIAIAAKTSDPHPKLPGTIHSAAQEIEAVGGKALPIQCDLRDENQIAESVEKAVSEFGGLDILINNAGNAHGLSSIQEGNIDDWDAMIDINVKGLLYVSKAIIPGMTQRNSGHIINIGSIAGKEVYPNGNVYCASKHAVDALTNGMRMDLNPFGIKVMGIHPGLVETEFSLVRFKGDEKRAETIYQGYAPLVAQDIADIVEFALTRPPHVVIADVVVLPTAQASATVIKKKLP